MHYGSAVLTLPLQTTQGSAVVIAPAALLPSWCMLRIVTASASASASLTSKLLLSGS